MRDMAAKCWASLGTARSSQSSQNRVLGLAGHIFVALCAQKQSCANKPRSSRCLHISWQARMSPRLPCTTSVPRGAEAISSPSLLSWDFIPGCARMPSIHPAHVIIGAGQGMGSPASLPACRNLPYQCTKPASNLSSSLARRMDTLREGTRDSH